MALHNFAAGRLLGDALKLHISLLRGRIATIATIAATADPRLAASRLGGGLGDHSRIEQLQHATDAQAIDTDVQPGCFLA